MEESAVKALQVMVIALCAFGIGFGLPLLIYLSVRGGRGIGELERLSRAIGRVSDRKDIPDDMAELSRRVAELKKNENTGNEIQNPGEGS